MRQVAQKGEEEAMSIFGIKREKVKDIRRKRAKQTLKQRHEESDLERKAQLQRKRAELYEAKARVKKAKKAASRQWPVPYVPLLTVKKKKQGKILTRKGRVRLF